jgi:H+-transporting ATP synthase F0 complex subunit s
LDNEALPMLAAVKSSLEELQLSSCGDISDSGIKSLSCLSNLHHLLLYDLPEVTNKKDCIEFLHSALPKCDIEFPYARISEIKNKNE